MYKNSPGEVPFITGSIIEGSSREFAHVVGKIVVGKIKIILNVKVSKT